MDEGDQFLGEVLSGIAEADVVTIFFPLLRRALVVDTRHDETTGYLVRVAAQAASMEDRIRSIERWRPHLGKVRSILGIPWVKSVRQLGEHRVVDSLVTRLVEEGMPEAQARREIVRAVEQLWKLEQIAFVRLVRGEGYGTIWSSRE